MGQRAQRSVVAATCAFALVGASLASFNACSLDSNGLGPEVADGASFDAPITTDATLDVAQPDTSPPPDVVADVIGKDAACAPIETSCLDGVDNDCNGLTDCADPACSAGYTCVPDEADSGFAPSAIYAMGRTAPCPASYPTQSDTFEDLISGPATCTACTCPANGASCGAATLACNATAAACGGTGVLVGDACEAFDSGAPFGPATSCELGAPQVTPGSCVPSGGVATLPPLSFGQLSRVCTTTEGPGGGCSSGSVCAAKVPSGFHGACVFQATDGGAASCPAGFGSAHLTTPSATSYDDTRECTSCSCTGSPTGAACKGAATLYPAAACATDAGTDDAAAPPPVTLPADGHCHGSLFAAVGTFASVALDAGVANQGTCAPSGGQPEGAVTPTNQTIYCCQN